MRSGFHLWVKWCALLSLVPLQLSRGEVGPQLGEPPRAPMDIANLPKSPQAQAITGGFTVNIGSREETRSFFNAVYNASEGVPINSTAVTASCFQGTNAPAYYDAVLRRINWFRTMAGVPAVETFNATDCVHDQAAALIMSANDSLSHFPPITWTCYSAIGANAASNSDLALGFVGPDAISGYIEDYGSPNYPLGHRRWILYPQTKIMGTGDVPPQGALKGANATWVLDGNYGGPRPTTRTGYVSWPPPGFTPYQVVFPRWSFAYPNADFSNAKVTMTSNGVPIAVRLEVYDPNSYGENTLVWVPLGLDANTFGTTWPFSGTDTVYTVAISNIVNASSSSYRYTVTIFDPAVPGADYFPPTISGPSQTPVGQATSFHFTSVTNANGHQWRSSFLSALNFFDGAENGLGNFTLDVSPNYAVITNTIVAQGVEAFHLAMPSPASQIMTLTRVLIPATNSVLSFSSLLGLATPTQVARVQVSADSGATWKDLYTQAGINDWGEKAFTLRSISLANLAGQSVQLRFNYYYTPFSSYYNDVDTGIPGFYDGWYLDNITVSNCLEVVDAQTNNASGTNFTFTTSKTGSYALQARALMFTDYPLGWGPIKLVTASSGGSPTFLLNQPILAGNQVVLNFSLQSGTASGFHLLTSTSITGPWTTNSAASFATNVPGSSYRFTVPLNGSAQFYKVRSP